MSDNKYSLDNLVELSRCENVHPNLPKIAKDMVEVLKNWEYSDFKIKEEEDTSDKEEKRVRENIDKINKKFNHILEKNTSGECINVDVKHRDRRYSAKVKYGIGVWPVSSSGIHKSIDWPLVSSRKRMRTGIKTFIHEWSHILGLSHTRSSFDVEDTRIFEDYVFSRAFPKILKKAEKSIRNGEIKIIT